MWQVEVIYLDGSAKKYDISAASKAAFESNFQCGFVRRIADEQRESDLYWIAHFLAKAKGETPLDFDKWLETIEDVNFDANAKNGLTGTASSTK
jgi:hypothetical protein